MACNDYKGLKVLCAFKIMKGKNERLLKTTPIYTIALNPSHHQTLTLATIKP